MTKMFAYQVFSLEKYMIGDAIYSDCKFSNMASSADPHLIAPTGCITVGSKTSKIK